MSDDYPAVPPPRPVLQDIDRKRVTALNQILIRAAISRRAEINEEILRVSGSKVARGPFAGAKLVTATSWGEGDFTPKILGCYEEELHPAFEKAIARQPSKIVNIGCAEGYYAVGLARRLPKAQIFAFDIDPKAQQVCGLAASENGMADRMKIEGACTSERLRAFASDGARSLIVIDAEGAELQLLDDPTARALAKCDLIVECHDFIDRTVTPTLSRRFATSHAVEVVSEGARDPNKITELRALASLDRWLAVCEFRPECMNWLLCWAR